MYLKDIHKYKNCIVYEFIKQEIHKSKHPIGIWQNLKYVIKNGILKISKIRVSYKLIIATILIRNQTLFMLIHF